MANIWRSSPGMADDGVTTEKKSRSVDVVGSKKGKREKKGKQGETINEFMRPSN